MNVTEKIKLPPSNQALRLRILEERGELRDSSGLRHFALVNVIALVGAALALSFVHSPTALELLVFPLTFIYGNIVEYWVHRTPLHHEIKRAEQLFHMHSTQHHGYFTAQSMEVTSPQDYQVVFFPLRGFVMLISIFVLPLSLLLGKLFSTNVAALFLTASMAYYVSYEWMHLFLHFPLDSKIMRLPLMRSLASLHRIHHDPRRMRHLNFNVLFPLGDFLFRTGSWRQPAPTQSPRSTL